jgi:hypothetical protein
MPSTEGMRTAAGLREILFEQIEGVRDGSVETGRAKAIANLASTILKSVEVEMQFRAQQETLDKAPELGVMPLAQLPDPRPAPTQPGQPRLVRGQAQSGSK